MSDPDSLSCPTPLGRYERVVLAHGGGGRVMHRLIESMFRARFAGAGAPHAHDAATFELAGRVALTTDSFTVRPLFFPGGDIGKLAVTGTVNDLAMAGARARQMSAAFVLEEGLLLADLERIVESMARCAREADVAIVTGDTKVVERGKGDGVFITTAAVGEVISPHPIEPRRVGPGDAVIVSGPVGDHGIAVLSRREGIAFGTDLVSDVAPIAGAALALVLEGLDVRCMRDPTRGGLATTLCEIAEAARVGIRVDEVRVPIRAGVADACELLGLDPLYVPSEGRFVAFVADADAERALDVLRREGCPDASRIGAVVPGHAGTVVLAAPTGGERVLDMLSGEQLPRIC